ncbi:MAG TPA: 2-oxoacid:acceptor oxidoreductase family protein, partial [Anaeromyxobacter sp.]|nr:2-oxoacid:acceptor oxidoreductase family protein [Anaeromyxobacter sp.]
MGGGAPLSSAPSLHRPGEEDAVTGDPLPGRPAHGLEALLPLEIRVHGRGGQGGVTCAKLLATLYADLGLHVQSFGDYGMERSGAPVRAFTRVDAAPITNRNKVYAPRHLLVLDPTLMGDEVLEGTPVGGLLLLNTAAPLVSLKGRHLHLRLAVVDAGGIARRHGIGTSAVVIVNTSMVGAYARLAGLRFEAVERTFALHELEEDLEAAREAFAAVLERPASLGAAPPGRPGAPTAAVLAITE